MGISLPSDNILLIGFMGSGKSTVGRHLAKTLNYQFIDTDALIESSEGRTINDIFISDGEEYFRSLERSLLAWLGDYVRHCVVSTGGGLPIHNRGMRKAGTVVYLEANFNTIAKRIDADEAAKRPLFQDLDKAKELFLKRISFYEDEADISVNVDDDLENIIKKITESLKEKR